MKKIFILVIVIVILVSTTSCEVYKKKVSTMTSYKDPQTMGGYWDITTQTGQTFNHVKCTYWGTSDDTASFVTDDGVLIFQSGAVVCVRSK